MLVFALDLRKSFPREHWSQIVKTNLLNRVHREIERCCDVMGIDPNDEAIAHLVGP